MQKGKLHAQGILFWIVFICIPFKGIAQKDPEVIFNHLTILLDSADAAALNANGFINKELAFTRNLFNAQAGLENNRSFYLFSKNGYIECMDTTGSGEKFPSACIHLSVDSVGGLNVLKPKLDSVSRNIISGIMKNMDGKMIPWCRELEFMDSVQSKEDNPAIRIMEYHPYYFSRAGLDGKNNMLTRKAFLGQYIPEKYDRVMQQFTGVQWNVTQDAFHYYEILLPALGYVKTDDELFTGPDGFTIRMHIPEEGESAGLQAIAFSAVSAGEFTMRITDNLTLVMAGDRGWIAITR